MVIHRHPMGVCLSETLAIRHERGVLTRVGGFIRIEDGTLVTIPMTMMMIILVLLAATEKSSVDPRPQETMALNLPHHKGQRIRQRRRRGDGDALLARVGSIATCLPVLLAGKEAAYRRHLLHLCCPRNVIYQRQILRPRKLLLDQVARLLVVPYPLPKRLLLLRYARRTPCSRCQLYPRFGSRLYHRGRH